MRVLLDTHALLWWSLDDPKLSRRAYDAIARDAASVYLSAASAWEITTKVRIGKLPRAAELSADIAGYLAGQGFSELPISVDHGQRAGLLPGPHKDPFDRILIAQAQTEKLVLISNETVFDRYGIVRLW
jgi:PIN domain nuclease of toxin-antitoxin system